MNMIKTTLMLLVVWHGLMLGLSIVMCKNDFVTLRSVAKAVILHDVKFLTANCNYPKAKIICTILFVSTALIANVIYNVIF